MRTRRSRGDSPMCAGLIAVFRRREGRIIPGGSTLLEKGTARWVRNYDLWRKERKVQETNRHELRYDVVVVGGGSAGLSAALILGRSRRQTLVVDAGEPRNAPSSGVHGFFSRDGISPEELLEIGREQLEPYLSVEVRSERVSGTSGENGDLEVILDDGSVVRARKLVLATGVVDELPDKPGFEELWGRGVYHCPTATGGRTETGSRRGGGRARGLHPKLEPRPRAPDRRPREPERRRTTDAPRPRYTSERREDLVP